MGYRMDMIKPADAPREVLLSKGDQRVRLRSKNRQHSTNTDYVTDYHKVDFQLIYCLRGRIRVVYEDQGPPFWLEPGDCVLQPPEIRHRVLEAEAGSEVLELSSPAEHETWVDHEITLPTAKTKPDRLFSGQRFVRSIASTENLERDLGLYEATSGLASVRVLRIDPSDSSRLPQPAPGRIGAFFVVAEHNENSDGSVKNISSDSESLLGSGAGTSVDVLCLELNL
jgi:mannose-6-phosphate isomerase-like protein (cupin superfamily)